MTGAMAAERILRANGIYDVTIVQASGVLTDNYNPVNKTLNLSPAVYGGDNVSAVAVAAHECGHAIQHAQNYPLLMLRKSVAPVCNIGSTGSYICILLGILFSFPSLILIGAILFSGIVFFNLITLPVEVDASRRALSQVEQMNLGEAPVVAHVVEVRVGIDQGDGLVRQEFDDGFDVAQAHAGIQQQRGRLSLDQVADDFLEMMRLVDRRDAGRHAVRFEPAAFAGDLFQFFKCSQFTHVPIVSRAGKNDTWGQVQCVPGCRREPSPATRLCIEMHKNVYYFE